MTEPPDAVLDAGDASVLSGTFESASAACNDWQVTSADAIRSVPPHSGSFACRICATGLLPEMMLDRSTGALEPGRYLLKAWIRRRDDRPAPDAVTASLRARTSEGTVTAQSTLTVRGDYDSIEVPLELTTHATRVRIRFEASAQSDQCLLVDDVSFERER